MNHLERFYATIERRPVDRPASWLGLPVSEAEKKLFAHFKVSDIKELKNEFGSRVSFCGGVDAQDLLINGTPKQVTEKVAELKRIFPTGLIVSPSHEAILSDTKPENISALFDAVNKD